MLKESFGRDSIVLPMPCEGMPSAGRRDEGPARVLWIGRISPEKRPDWLLEIAGKLPHLQFDVVGDANKNSTYAREFFRRTEAMPNVKVAGRVPYQRIADYYRRASMLCSTSVFEGFPNVYLEAWSAGIPVVATCDPDCLIDTLGLGRTASTVDDLARAIDALARSPSSRREIGSTALDYYMRHHTVDTAMHRFVEFFSSLATTRARVQPGARIE
jgi:glycosyltransferase involved in cell wall biosynthesis